MKYDARSEMKWNEMKWNEIANEKIFETKKKKNILFVSKEKRRKIVIPNWKF